MKITLTVVLAALLQAHESDLKRLLDRLSSESIEERQAASEELLRKGESVRRTLEEARRKGQGEAAQRAADVLEILDFRKSLGPAFLKAFPNLDRKLVRAQDSIWTEVFLDATEQKNFSRKHPELRGPDLEPLAARALRGASPNQWREVCHRVMAWNLRSAVPALLERLKVPDESSHHLVADALVHFEAVDAVPIAIKLLEKEQDNQKQMAYSQILGSVGGRDALTFILQQIKKERFALGGMAMHYLAISATEEDIPALVSLLDLDDTPSPNELGRVLTQVNPKKAIPLLKEKCDRATGSTRMMAAHTLCSIRHRAAAPHIRELLKDRNRNIRLTAAGSLGAYEDAETTGDLRPLLKESDLGMRLTAARILVQQDDPEAFAVIRELARDPQLANSVAGYLPFDPSKDIEKEMVETLRQRKPGWMAALGWAARHRPEVAIEASAPLLKDKDEYTRRAAIGALAATGRPELADLIIPLLKDPANGVPHEAAEQLGKLGGRKALDALLKELADPQTKAINGVLRGLAQLKSLEAVPALMKALESPDTRPRAEVIQTLLRIDPPELKASVKILLTDSDSQVRLMAAQALTRRGERDGVPGVLKHRYDLFLLNAVRSPDAWKRLVALRFDPPIARWGKRGLEELARRSGLALEIDEDFDYSWPSLTYGAKSPIEALANSQVLLEERSIRILPQSKLAAFWQDWWMRESARPPGK